LIDAIHFFARLCQHTPLNFDDVELTVVELHGMSRVRVSERSVPSLASKDLFAT
jgi:hypothetical protein